MKKREFNKILNSCCDKKNGRKILNFNKLNSISVEKRHEMALFVIKEEGMLFPEMITELMDERWLCSMGYFYKREINGIVFRCLSKDSQ